MQLSSVFTKLFVFIDETPLGGHCSIGQGSLLVGEYVTMLMKVVVVVVVVVVEVDSE